MVAKKGRNHRLNTVRTPSSITHRPPLLTGWRLLNKLLGEPSAPERFGGDLENPGLRKSR
jgi:hypothetical protein